MPTALEIADEADTHATRLVRKLEELLEHDGCPDQHKGALAESLNEARVTSRFVGSAYLELKFPDE